MEYRPDLLCKNLPNEFLSMMKSIRALRYDQKPNYEIYKNLIKECMVSNGV